MIGAQLFEDLSLGLGAGCGDYPGTRGFGELSVLSVKGSRDW